LSVLSKQCAFLNFDELLAKIVDYVLRSVFSERFVFSVWTYLEMAASIEPLDIARKPEAFEACLKNLFGSAAEHLEKLILKMPVPNAGNKDRIGRTIQILRRYKRAKKNLYKNRA